MHLGDREKMMCIETQHFGLNRILLLTIGLWPYQQSKFIQLQVILFFSILTSIIVFQLAIFVTAECTPDLVIQVLSSILWFAMYIIKYNSFWSNIQNVRYLLEQLQQICKELKNENEIAIIENYGCDGRNYTIRITVFGIFNLLIVVTQPMWQRIFGVYLFTNQSRSHYTIQTEYFIDREKYFYLILLHTNTAICIGTAVIVATGTMLNTCIKLVCGLLTIASYRIEQAMENNIQRKIGLENETMIYKEIIYAVDIHRKAIKLCNFVISSFEGSFFLLIAFGVISLSLNLFRVVLSRDIEEFFLCFVYIASILSYMFLANYAAQEVTDHNDHVFITAYNIQWYTAPLYIQRMILFLLQRGTKVYYLKIGRLFAASLESFSTLVSASMSYFAMLHSMR